MTNMIHLDSYELIWTHMDSLTHNSYDFISCAFIISYELMHLFMTMRQIAYNCPLWLSMIFPSRRKSSGKRPLKKGKATSVRIFGRASDIETRHYIFRAYNLGES
jgi:hypothetical protein